MMANGNIFQINASPGGVPKLGQGQAEVTPLGLSNDQHRNMRAHGGPERALCLYSLERILALQAEGHPIFPGSVGENLTIRGLDWPAVAPGVRLQIGAEVVAEVTRYTTPCGNIVDSFSDRDSMRISQDTHPGWSRVYARVLRTGLVRVGDKVTILDNQ
jgi:MOSC domain-containing protein YiiM